MISLSLHLPLHLNGIPFSDICQRAHFSSVSKIVTCFDSSIIKHVSPSFKAQPQGFHRAIFALGLLVDWIQYKPPFLLKNKHTFLQKDYKALLHVSFCEIWTNFVQWRGLLVIHCPCQSNPHFLVKSQKYFSVTFFPFPGGWFSHWKRNECNLIGSAVLTKFRAEEAKKQYL